MNISSVASSHSQAVVREGTSIHVLKKAQNLQKLEGQAAVALIEGAEAVSAASRPAPAPASPGGVDLYA